MSDLDLRAVSLLGFASMIGLAWLASSSIGPSAAADSAISSCDVSISVTTVQPTSRSPSTIPDRSPPPPTDTTTASGFSAAKWSST